MNQLILQKIAGQRRTRRIASVMKWLALGLLLLLLPLVAGAAFDSSRVIPQHWRWVLFGAVALAALRFLFTAWNALRVPADREMAAILDRHTELKGGYAVSTSMALAEASGGTEEEAALRERLHQEAIKLAAKSDPRHPWPAWWLVAFSCALIAGGAFLFSSRGQQPFLRVLTPWQNLPYTTVDLSGPQKLPLANEPFSISGQVHGRVAPVATLTTSTGKTMEVQLGSGGEFHYTFEKGVPSGLTLTAKCSQDGVSAPLKIVLRNLPLPATYAHQVTPPEYTGAKTRIETMASFSILRASRTIYSVTFDKPAAGVRLVMDNERVPVELTNSASQPNTWTKDLGILPRSTGYHFEVAEADGVFRPVGDPQQILVMPDKPPVAEIASHNGGELKSPRDIFKMKAAAHDDYGLAGMRVIYYKLGDADQKKAQIVVPENVAKHSGDLEIPLTGLNAQPHDVVVVMVQAVDNNTLDGPGLGSSEPLLVEVPDDPDKKDDGGGGGGGGGGSPQRINPLAIEKKIYRDSLMLSLGRSSVTVADLAARQAENNQNMGDMAEAVESRDVVLAGQLRVAQREGVAAAKLLSDLAARPGGSYVKALDQEAKTVAALALAARLQQQNPPGGGEGEGQAEKQFSLDQKQSAGEDPMSEEDKIKKALAELKEAQEKQDEINAKLEKDAKQGEDPSKSQQAQNGQPGKDGQQGEGKEGQDGQGQQPGEKGQGQAAGEGEGQGQAGNGKGEGKGQGQGQGEGQGQGQGQGGLSPEEMAELRQEQLAAQSESQRLRDELSKLKMGPAGTDPGQAAHQMEQAAGLQGEAAMGNGHSPTGKKFRPGFEASKAIAKARVITESLLSGKADAADDGAEAPPAYQGLIQQYSKRLSYDE